MIDSIADLGLNDLDPADKDLNEKLNVILAEKLGITIEDLKNNLSNYIIGHAEELTLNIPNIAPCGDFGNLIEDNDKMAEYLKTEACKLEHWFLSRIAEVEKPLPMIRFDFTCRAIDDGESCNGKIFLNKSGKIKHCMVEIVS